MELKRRKRLEKLFNIRINSKKEETVLVKVRTVLPFLLNITDEKIMTAWYDCFGQGRLDNNDEKIQDFVDWLYESVYEEV